MKKRRQLTLFLDEKYSQAIENIRWLYNSEQYKLISAHITLCRENELHDIEKVIYNLNRLRHRPVHLTLTKPVRLDNGNGVLLPVTSDCQALRKEILSGILETPGIQRLHVTLMHPRNSCCTDRIFESISSNIFPTEIVLKKISLIEQIDNNEWQVLDEFALNKSLQV